MKATYPRVVVLSGCKVFVCFFSFALLTFGLLVPETLAEQPTPPKSADFFPMAVWYGGGEAPAPLLAPHPKRQRPILRADLEKIRELGFNAIRCWGGWATGEPQQGQDRKSTRLNSRHSPKSDA